MPILPTPVEPPGVAPEPDHPQQPVVAVLAVIVLLYLFLVGVNGLGLRIVP